MLVKPDVNGQMENWDKYPDNLRSQTSIDTNIGQRKVKEGLGKEGLRLVMFWEMGPARLKPRTSMQNCAQPQGLGTLISLASGNPLLWASAMWYCRVHMCSLLWVLIPPESFTEVSGRTEDRGGWG